VQTPPLVVAYAEATTVLEGEGFNSTSENCVPAERCETGHADPEEQPSSLCQKSMAPRSFGRPLQPSW
jgi:hypothetical protein